MRCALVWRGSHVWMWLEIKVAAWTCSLHCTNILKWWCYVSTWLAQRLTEYLHPTIFLFLFLLVLSMYCTALYCTGLKLCAVKKQKRLLYSQYTPKFHRLIFFRFIDIEQRFVIIGAYYDARWAVKVYGQYFELVTHITVVWRWSEWITMQTMRNSINANNSTHNNTERHIQ